MANYFKNDETGKQQWQFMCESKGVKVEPIAITSQWAAKQCDQPYILKNWRKHTGKIINWIKKDTDRRTPAPTPLVSSAPRGRVIKSTQMRRERTAEEKQRITEISRKFQEKLEKKKMEQARAKIRAV